MLLVETQKKRSLITTSRIAAFVLLLPIILLIAAIVLNPTNSRFRNYLNRPSVHKRLHKDKLAKRSYYPHYHCRSERLLFYSEFEARTFITSGAFGGDIISQNERFYFIGVLGFFIKVKKVHIPNRPENRFMVLVNYEDLRTR
jgi:hypothetical protein